MKDIKDKLVKIRDLKYELEFHIWNIFDRYIELEGILFSHPNDWGFEGDGIYFSGSDGCMGCYDSKTTHIPIKFFEDPDVSFNERIKELKQDKEDRIRDSKSQKQRDELKELKRLKEKYDE